LDYIAHNIRKDMIPKGDIPGECMDCGTQIMYSKKIMQTHAELLKKHRCPKCGHFALKTLSTKL
jgi:DNA-directed RNA polymerase subunit RPC12/RpoP